ncbi:MAG: family 43 glycosylhydrolase [Lachnospiraceae bacterium]|nr:family 43 glycosylhydrolase [Lachnospiraceae bacterium]
MKKSIYAGILSLMILLFAGCGEAEKTNKDALDKESQDTIEALIPDSEVSKADALTENDVLDGNKENAENGVLNEDDSKEEDKTMTIEDVFANLTMAKGYKGFEDGNPIMIQSYGADPFAMVYKDRVYFYMTADNEDYDSKGELKENGYGQIKTIRIVSTDDFVNYEDHGYIKIAGTICKWARNSWAPAACWKNIDGKDKFFVYFADSGNGIGVVTADSPTGPFTDPLGTALINRKTPNCANVEWLFDPAVMVDDDGTGYLYFGGGIPASATAAAPGTGRCVKLGDDMISLATEPVSMDIPYLFEDSGIHKYNDKYYYSYCTNWNVDAEGTKTYGFNNAEIVVMESDSPLGPFVYKERVLKNPGTVFGLYGNNHHCIFTFNGEWYITYHARTLEKYKKIEKGYRSTHVNSFKMGEDGSIGNITMNKKGPEALKNVDAYSFNMASCGAILAGVTLKGADEVSLKEGCGTMTVSGIDSGDYIFIRNVDFKEKKAEKVIIKLAKCSDVSEDAGIMVTTGMPTRKQGNNKFALYEVLKSANEGEYIEYSFELLDVLEGVQNIGFIFAGSGYEMLGFKFE